MADRRIDIDIVGNDQASAVFKQVSSNLSGMGNAAGSGIDKLNDALHRYNTAMSGLNRITKIGLGAAGYAIYKFTKDSINSFAEFERQHAKTMGAIATNYDKTSQSQAKFLADQQKLKEQALQLGTWGPNNKGALYNPTQVASTQTALTKAGFNATQAGGVVSPIIKFAGGNDLELETATDYAVNVAEMFGVKRDSKAYTKMLDQITKAADISTIDVPDIFESLKYTGGIASSLKRPLSEVLGMISVMGNAGLKGTMAGTGIQAFFTRILNPITGTSRGVAQPPSQKAQDTLDAFVKTVTDANGKFKDMPTVTSNLDTAMSGLNDKEQAWFSQKLFGLFQMKAGFTLARNGGDPLKNVIGQIENGSSGANEKKWDIMLDSAYGTKERLSNTWSGFKTDIGYRLQPFTTSIMDELFDVFANKGNYKINFTNIQDGLKKTTDMISQQYGKQLGDLVYNLGDFGIDATRILNAVKPTIGGVGLGYAKLLTGDIPGALKAFKDGVEGANKGIGDLPENLQSMGKQVRNAIVTLGALAGINFAAKIAENITGIGKFISHLKGVNQMNVTASTVILKDTGLVDKDGNPIYEKSTTESKGNGKSGGGGGSTIVGTGEHGSTSAKPEGKTVLVDSHGNPLTHEAEPVKPAFGTKIAGALGKASWIYGIMEMLGINDMLLDKTPAKNGTTARKVIDSGRSVLDWGMTGSFIDDVMFKGAIKGAISRNIISNAPQIGASITDAITGAIATVGVGGALATGGAVAGGISVVADAYMNNKKLQKNTSEIHDNIAKGRNVYVTNDGKVTYTEGAKEKQANYDKHKYEYGGGESQTYITSPAPTKPSAWLAVVPTEYARRLKEYNSDLEKYKQNMAEIQNSDAIKKQRFGLAQQIFNQNTGQNLDWNQYQATQGAWQKILPDQMFGTTSSFSGALGPMVSTLISMQPAFKKLTQAQDASGKVSTSGLQTALSQVANNSSGLSQKLMSIANSGSGTSKSMESIAAAGSSTSKSMASIAANANTVAGRVGGTINMAADAAYNRAMGTNTGNALNDAMNAGKVAGQIKGNTFDIATFMNKLDPLSTMNQHTNNILVKLDPMNTNITGLGSKLNTINSSIQAIPAPQVMVNVPAPNVNVKVDKDGNITQSTTGGSQINMAQDAAMERLWKLSSSRFGK